MSCHKCVHPSENRNFRIGFETVRTSFGKICNRHKESLRTENDCMQVSQVIQAGEALDHQMLHLPLYVRGQKLRAVT